MSEHIVGVEPTVYNGFKYKSKLEAETAETLDKMEAAEQEFFGDRENPLFSWDGIYIANLFRKRGFTVKAASQVINEKRRITPAEIEKWFTPESSKSRTSRRHRTSRPGRSRSPSQEERTAMPPGT